MAYPILYAAEKFNDQAEMYLTDDQNDRYVKLRAGAIAFDALVALTFLVVGILGAIGTISAAPGLALLTVGIGLTVFHALIAIKYQMERHIHPFKKIRGG